MKKAIDIIKKKFSVEGFPVDREWALRKTLARLPQAKIYQYGNTVFTVDAGGVVHLFRDGGKVGLIEATRLFMADTAGQTLSAPIKNKRVMRLAEFFRWRCLGNLGSGYKVYEVKR
jgi:hypothetical protein